MRKERRKANGLSDKEKLGHAVWEKENREKRNMYSRAYKKKQYSDNPEYVKRHRTDTMARSVKKKYGLTLEQYYEVKSRGCESCETHDGILCIDHDHSNPEPNCRGCLCHGCNVALGRLKDSPELIDKLKTYLTSRPKR